VSSLGVADRPDRRGCARLAQDHPSHSVVLERHGPVDVTPVQRFRKPVGSRSTADEPHRGMCGYGGGRGEKAEMAVAGLCPRTPLAAGGSSLAAVTIDVSPC
jgi:hypothetical protein